MTLTLLAEKGFEVKRFIFSLNSCKSNTFYPIRDRRKCQVYLVPTPSENWLSKKNVDKVVQLLITKVIFRVLQKHFHKYPDF